MTEWNSNMDEAPREDNFDVWGVAPISGASQRFVDCFYDQTGRLCWYSGKEFEFPPTYTPTHWMHRPTPPKELEE